MIGFTKAFDRLQASIDRWRLRRVASRRMHELSFQWRQHGYAGEAASPRSVRRMASSRDDFVAKRP